MRLWPFHRRTEPEALAVTPESLEGFVRAGGAVGLETWVRLPTDLQVALEKAGARVATERLVGLAALIRNPEMAEDLVSQVDGGEAGDEMSIRAALDGAMRSIRSGRAP